MLLAALVALTAVAGTPADALPPEKPIQPGARVVIDGAQCTVNFVFKHANTRFIGTAGHCAADIGVRAEVDGEEFGTVVYRRNDETLDFALIHIDGARLDDVEPSMRGFGGPTGTVTVGEAGPGTLVSLYGYGIVVGANPLTRPRPGVLLSFDDRRYTMNAPAVSGDSGGPIIHRDTGEALGIISAFNFFGIPPTTDYGPTVVFIKDRLAAAGFDVSLVKAPYEG